MSVSIIVPFRPDGAGRDRNWRWLKSRYQWLYPDWELVEGTCEGRWSKGRAVNAAVEASCGDVLVISDADVLVGESVLREAVSALDSAPWVVPHRLVFRLNEEATQAVIDGRLRTGPVKPPEDSQMPGSPRRGAPGGGISVLRRQDFIGVDERFTDWGGEDISFARALDTIIGPHRCLAQVMWHLYHEPMFRRDGNRASDQNEELANRYLAASGNPLAIQDLLDERSYPAENSGAGGIVIVPRETYAQAPFDPRFQGWGQEDESFGVALTCLAGEPTRGDAELVHLHHEKPERISRVRGSVENFELRRRYVEARSSPEAMRSLIEEADAA